MKPVESRMAGAASAFNLRGPSPNGVLALNPEPLTIAVNSALSSKAARMKTARSGQ